MPTYDEISSVCCTRSQGGWLELILDPDRVAFVCTVTQGGFLVQGYQAKTDGVAVINIGHDDVEPINYSAVIGLSVLPGGMPELYLKIIEADNTTGAEYIFSSGKDTRFISKRLDRKNILASIVVGLRGLLAMVGPDEFVWFTHDENMPKKALAKFATIKRTVQACSYSVRTSRLSEGRKMWRAKRLSAS